MRDPVCDPVAVERTAIAQRRRNRTKEWIRVACCGLGRNPPSTWGDLGRKAEELSRNLLPPLVFPSWKISGGAGSRMRTRLRNAFPCGPGNYREQLWKSALRRHIGPGHRSRCRSLAPFSLCARTGKRNRVSREVREAIRVRDLPDLNCLGMAVCQKRTGRFAPIPAIRQLSATPSKRTSAKRALWIRVERWPPYP